MCFLSGNLTNCHFLIFALLFLSYTLSLEPSQACNKIEENDITKNNDEKEICV